MGKGFMGKLCGLLLLVTCGALHAQHTVTYVYTDPQGTPLAEADAQGNITARFDYAPYGTASTNSGMSGAPNGPGYTGHVNDPDTGLVYMQQRYFDPVTGRFLSIDPEGPTPGNGFTFNRYAYADNNPIMHTDPDGRCVDGLTCDQMVQSYGKWAAANPAQADKIGSAVGVPGVGVMLVASGLGDVVAVARGAVILDKVLSDSPSPSATTTLQRNVAQGKAGEAATAAKYADQITGKQVTFKTSDGTRTVTDFVTSEPGVIETKTGGAVLSKGQTKLFEDIKAGREVTPVGKNATNAGLESGKPTVLKSCTVDRC